MRWACRRLQHVKPCIESFFLAGRPSPSAPQVRWQACFYTAGPVTPGASKIPSNGTPTGDFRSSYEQADDLVAPPAAADGAPGQFRLLPLDHQQRIYQLLQHIQEGIISSKADMLMEPDSISFWTHLLESCLAHDALMPDILAFAQWWGRDHGVHWPKFYQTIISFYLSQDRLSEARFWHKKLCSVFLPERREFAALLCTFATNPSDEMHKTLRFIYSRSPHQNIYDLIIPFLYARGMGQLAHKWHACLCSRKDFPTRRASRAFLVHLRAYYHQTFLNTLPERFQEVPEQGAEASEASPAGHEFRDESHDAYGNDSVSSTSECLGSPKPPGLPETGSQAQTELPLDYVPKETLGERYGEMFGISEKEYGDPLGARWLASTWVSLDSAINVLHGLGIEEIGPLSLQVIASREKTWGTIWKRLGHLSGLGIRVQKCNYTLVLVKLVRLREQDNLDCLLGSDVHPHSYEDLDLLNRLRVSCQERSDERGAGFWRRALDIIIHKQSNRLALSLYEADHNKILDVLDDLAAANMELSQHYVLKMVQTMVSQVPRHNDDVTIEKSTFKFHIDSLVRLLRLGAPIPAWAWRRLLFSLGRHNHLDLLEDLAIAITQHLLHPQKLGPGFIAVDRTDIPPYALAAEDLGTRRLRIPNDLPARHEWHPFNRIFRPRLQTAIVRWGMMQSLSTPRRINDRDVFKGGGKPVEFFVARGVRLLRLLHDQGLATIPTIAIQKSILMRLADLYGPEIRHKQFLKAARASNTLSLEEFVNLCNEAWGKTLVPRGANLLRLIGEYVERSQRSHLRYLETRARSDLTHPQKGSPIVTDDDDDDDDDDDEDDNEYRSRQVPGFEEDQSLDASHTPSAR